MEEKDTCDKCRTRQAVNVCLGCHAAICETCSQFELFGSGCGCVFPAHYCLACADDPRRNPFAVQNASILDEK